MTLIEQLKAAIHKQHGCDAILKESVRVREERGGSTLWEGDVYVFSLQGHQRARHCYAFQLSGTKHSPRLVAILAIGHVDSPRAAVQAAMVNESRRQGE